MAELYQNDPTETFPVSADTPSAPAGLDVVALLREGQGLVRAGQGVFSNVASVATDVATSVQSSLSSILNNFSITDNSQASAAPSDDPTTGNLLTLMRTGRNEQERNTIAAQRAQLDPTQRELLDQFQEALASGNTTRLEQLVASVNRPDERTGQRPNLQVLEAFRTNLFAAGISNSLSGNASSGYDLNLFQGQRPDQQILSFNRAGGRPSVAPYRSSDRDSRQDIDPMSLAESHPDRVPTEPQRQFESTPRPDFPGSRSETSSLTTQQFMLNMRREAVRAR